MSYLFENQNPAVMANGLNTNKNVSFGGSVAFTSAPTGPAINAVTTGALVGVTVVLTASQSGGVFTNPATSGTPIWTLPAAANGLVYTFICTSTTAGFAINTGTASVIHAKTNAAGTAITSTATTGAITNTQATAVVGDTITVVCDGTNWWMTAQSGIFAAS